MTLDEYLKSTGISARFIARKLGVPDSQISDWRHGRRVPVYRNMIAVRDATDGKVQLEDWGLKHE